MARWGMTLLILLPVLTMTMPACSPDGAHSSSSNLDETGRNPASETNAGSSESPVPPVPLEPPVIDSVSPTGKEAPSNGNIVVRFNVDMDATSVKGIEVTKNGWNGGPTPGEMISGTWSTPDGKQFMFVPARPLEAGSLVVIRPSDAVRSKDGVALHLDKPLYSFLVDDGKHRGSREIQVPSIKKTNNGAHNIPLHLTVPGGDGPYPVLFWVHGGGWNGGTPQASVAVPGNEAQYLADHLGVAVVGVAYRTKGSNGTFSEAMEDVADAIQYIRDHADEYRIDVHRLGLYGGSAGTPLASLTAQRTAEADFFIGYNGIYDFVNNPGSAFGKGNGYGQQEPSAEANSAIDQLREHPPAVLLLHGTADKTINPQQSVLFAKAVQAAGGQAKVLLYPGQEHAFFNPGKLMELPTLYEVKQFIQAIWALK